MHNFKNAAFYLARLFALLFACQSATVVAQTQTESATVAASEPIEEIKVWPAGLPPGATTFPKAKVEQLEEKNINARCLFCLLYTSPSPRDRQKSRMPSSA